jgi:site-specific DNA recombinase
LPYHFAADNGEQNKSCPPGLVEYDKPLVRWLVEKVTVYEDKFTVGFKSGVMVDVDE